MPLVVADAGPLHYLVLTGDIELPPKLFERVLVPRWCGMNSPTPKRRRPCATGSRMRQAGLTCGRLIRAPTMLPWAKLDDGERAAIALALAVKAELVLMDDREGVGIAHGRGLVVTGSLGVLDPAARRGLIDLAAVFEPLKATTFYYRQGLLEALLARHATRRGHRRV